MNTITDDELIDAMIAARMAWRREPLVSEHIYAHMGRAVLALAEQKQAAALAEQLEMERIRRDQLIRHAENLQAHNAELQARIAELEATQCARIAKLVHAAYFELQRYEYINATVKLRDAVAELDAQAAQPAVTHMDARQALEDMDDFARMSRSVEPTGAYKTLLDYITSMEAAQAPKPVQVAAPEGFDIAKLVTAARMVTQYRHSMSYNEAYFGEAPGLFKTRIAELDRALPALYPAAAIKAAPKQEGGEQ
jgi:hypothetical protein